MMFPTIQTLGTLQWRENVHRSGKGKNLASVLKYHGKMWYNFAVPHFAIPNFAAAKMPPPPPPVRRKMDFWNQCAEGFQKSHHLP